MKNLHKWLFVLFLALAPLVLHAHEFTGVKMEYMNTELTNFYGFGFFTSNRRFDAEVETFFATKMLKGTEETEEDLGYKWIESDYKLWYLAFSGYFHFIRSDKLSMYVGTGIMPLFPGAYVFHYTAGVDFFWDEDWRIFYNFRRLYNNADEYSYPVGPSMSVGIKFTFDD